MREVAVIGVGMTKFGKYIGTSAKDLGRIACLAALKDANISPKEIVSPLTPETHAVSELGVMALDHYNRAKDYLRQGNWAGYGKELENLERILRELSGKTKENSE